MRDEPTDADRLRTACMPRWLRRRRSLRLALPPHYKTSCLILHRTDPKAKKTCGQDGRAPHHNNSCMVTPTGRLGEGPNIFQLGHIWSSVRGMSLSNVLGTHGLMHPHFYRKGIEAQRKVGRAVHCAPVWVVLTGLLGLEFCRPRPYGRGYAHLQCCSGGL